MDNLARHFLLDPDVVFLNHGSYGACPAPVFAAYQAWQLRLERQPVAFLDPVRGYFNWLRDARTALAQYLGADAADLVGVMNATVGLNIVAQSLPLQPGDEILTTDHEYGATDKMWDAVVARTGARIVRARVPLPLTSAAAFTDALTAHITPRTRVLFVSHITSATALLFPIADIVAKARAHGIWTVIDGAHAPGQIPLNLDRLGADFYAGNCHKWMMAPKGAAFLHVRKDVQDLIRPLVFSHGWTPDTPAAAPGLFGNSAFIDRLEMQGTRDPAAFLAVPDAIRFAANHDWLLVARRCREMVDAFETRIAARTGLSPLASPAFRAPQMSALRLPRTDPDTLKLALMDQYNIEIPCFDWQDNTIVRVSVQGYNSAANLDVLDKALVKLLTLTRAA